MSTKSSYILIQNTFDQINYRTGLFFQIFYSTNAQIIRNDLILFVVFSHYFGQTHHTI